jgi:hypothetical protein
MLSCRRVHFRPVFPGQLYGLVARNVRLDAVVVEHHRQRRPVFPYRLACQPFRCELGDWPPNALIAAVARLDETMADHCEELEFKGAMSETMEKLVYELHRRKDQRRYSAARVALEVMEAGNRACRETFRAEELAPRC